MKPGDRIAHLEVRERLDVGGMGVVYRALDERLEREVALKVLHPGEVDAETRSRLLQEARILSRLQHPNICQIYEFLEGDPADPMSVDCLVLELIRGRTLSEALDSGLGRAEGLAIAEQIARALAATHARGVIHRDLKPANVMLTAEGEVKILDFGLARSPGVVASGQDDVRGARAEDGDVRGVDVRGDAQVETSGYHRTERGQVLGTASSMSPEQARGERITPASDVYSLGLLLQRLLTGEAPYEADLPHGVLLEKASEGDTRPVRGLDGDLTRLIESLKALAPEDRPSAQRVVEQVVWLRGRGRRRARWLAVAALLLASLLALGKYTLDLRHERNRALVAQQDAERARATAEEVSSFLVQLFETSDPGAARGQNLTARELLDRGAETIRRDLTDQPATQAQLMDVIGRIDHSLGLYEEAEPLLTEAVALRREALDSDDPELATSLHNLAVLYRDRGRRDEAKALFREALAIREQALGAHHPDVAATLNEFGVLHGMLGQLGEAEPLFRRVLEIREATLGSLHPSVASILNNLGIIHASRGEYAEAEPYFLRGLEIREAVLEDDHPDLAANLVALGSFYANQGQHAEGLPYYERGLEIWQRTLGPDHPRVGMTLTSMGSSYHQVGRDAEAEELLMQALAVRERALGTDHPDVAMTLRTLASFERDLGRTDAAESHLRRAIAIHEAASPPNLVELRGVYTALAALLRQLGRESEAQRYEQQATVEPAATSSSAEATPETG